MASNITFKFYLLKRRQKPNGEIPIYLRITKDRKYSLISTGLSVPEKDWNDKKGEVRKSNLSSGSLNSQLYAILKNAEQTALSLPDDLKNRENVKEAISDDNKHDFFAYANSAMNEMEQDNAYWEHKHTKTTINKLKAFIGRDTLLFDEITHQLINEFSQYLKNELGNSPNTINKELQRLRRIIKKALLDDIIQINPFDKVKKMKRVKSNKARLNIEQIEAIKALELKPNTWLSITRDAFLFSFYNAGIRFGDLSRLKWKHIIDGRLKYNMAKTDTGKSIKLLKPALEILEGYKPEQPNPEQFLFPILKPTLDYSDEMFLKRQISSKNYIANKNLKKLAKMAGIQEDISFHVSRHSFADFARTSGMNIYDISKALGHSDIQITQAYMNSFDENSLDNSMEQLFS